jgi:flagellar basal body-associated protein FliL
MSVNDTNHGGETTTAEAAPRGRSVSMWFLIVPIALTLAAAALAFFLLSPRDEELLTTTDRTAVEVAVANAQPAQPSMTTNSAAAENTAP